MYDNYDKICVKMCGTRLLALLKMGLRSSATP